MKKLLMYLAIAALLVVAIIIAVNWMTTASYEAAEVQIRELERQNERLEADNDNLEAERDEEKRLREESERERERIQREEEQRRRLLLEENKLLEERNLSLVKQQEERQREFQDLVDEIPELSDDMLTDRTMTSLTVVYPEYKNASLRFAGDHYKANRSFIESHLVATQEVDVLRYQAVLLKDQIYTYSERLGNAMTVAYSYERELEAAEGTIEKYQSEVSIKDRIEENLRQQLENVNLRLDARTAQFRAAERKLLLRRFEQIATGVGGFLLGRASK